MLLSGAWSSADSTPVRGSQYRGQKQKERLDEEAGAGPPGHRCDSGSYSPPRRHKVSSSSVPSQSSMVCEYLLYCAPCLCLYTTNISQFSTRILNFHLDIN